MEDKYSRELFGIVEIDIYKSTYLKQGQDREAIDRTFNGHNDLIEQTFKVFEGKRWRVLGDGGIYLFPSPNDAVDACLRLLERQVEFNKNINTLECPIFTRIGIHRVRRDIENVSIEKRDNYAEESLDILGKMEKNCPIGKIAISREVYFKLNIVKRDIFRPALSDELRKRGAYILRRRLIMPQEDILFDGLLDEQKQCIPPIAFPNCDKFVLEDEISLRTIEKLFETPILVIIGETQFQPQSPVSAASTSDAIGTIEIMAAARASNDVIAGLDRWEDTADIACDSNIIIMGSGIVNTYAYALNDINRPVRFIKTKKRIFEKVVASSKEGEIYFGPHDNAPKDCGIVLLSKSPFNIERSILWIAGITGIGTQSAARFVWDMIRDPKNVLRPLIGDAPLNPVACIVGPTVPQGPWEVVDYYRRWRIKDYEIIWMVDRDGKLLYSRNNE